MIIRHPFRMGLTFYDYGFVWENPFTGHIHVIGRKTRSS
jgi:hypothetical protein